MNHNKQKKLSTRNQCQHLTQQYTNQFSRRWHRILLMGKLDPLMNYLHT